MLFNSYIFLFAFLPITWFLWFVCCKFKNAGLTVSVLILASFFFYSWWNPPYLLLLLFSIIFNFFFGILASPVKRKILYFKNPHVRKGFLIFGIIVNVGLIGYFKYFNFLMGNIVQMAGFIWHAQVIFLPLGISFFTFQQITWLIDSYKGDTPEMAYESTLWERFRKYTLFVAFFPQLIAGPIVNHKEMIPQFQDSRSYKVNWHNVAMGLALISLGLFKKLVIADTLSPLVNDGFDSAILPTLFAPTFFEAWGIALAYTFQLYFDFSGYSDMALGLGKLFNIDIPINFNSPYKSTSIIEFWRRWHMTLSRWLRDSLYIPLGGNRLGESRRYLNLLLTMLIGGLWHGAGWTFVFWGFLHGLYLCVNHLWRKLNISTPKPVAWLITFISIVVAWVFFRALTIDSAIDILRGMLGLNGFYAVDWLADICNNLGFNFVHSYQLLARPVFMVSYFGKNILFLFLLLIIVLFFNNTNEFVNAKLQKPKVKHAIIIGLVLVVAVGYLSRVSEFLYFQF